MSNERPFLIRDKVTRVIIPVGGKISRIGCIGTSEFLPGVTKGGRP